MSNIVLDTGRIIGNAQATGISFTNKLRIVSQLTPQTAELLGVRYTLFQKDGVIRFGAKSVDLEVQYDNAWFIHEIEKVGRLELAGVTVQKFKAFRVGDGKKKPKRMMISFQVVHVGNPFPLTEHLMKVMRGIGVVTIKPTEDQQVPMFTVEVVPEEAAAPAEGKQWPVPNERGVFENVKPIARYKSNDKKWHAELRVVETAGGWVWGCSVASTIGGAVQAPNINRQFFSSEVEAISTAALDVKEWADQHCSSGSSTSKREAKKMRDWAVKYVQAQTVIDAATEIGFEQLAKPEYPD